MKIKKFMYIMIGMVVLIGLILPVSYAADVSIINTSLNRPETFQKVVDGKYHTQFNICAYRSGGVLASPEGIDYLLQTFEIVSDNAISVWFKGTRICCSDVFDYCTQNCFDLSTGSFVTSYSNGYWISEGIGGSDYKYIVSSQPLPQVQNRQVDQYVLDVPSWLTESYTRSNEFVNWSVSAPDVAIYNSKLSEPQWDLYNRYFVVDDKLYWISFNINGFYVKNDDIEGTSELYYYQTDEGTTLRGYLAYEPIDISSIVRYDDLPYRLVLVPASDGWKIKFIENDSFIGVEKHVDIDIYTSVFNLEDGAYLDSSFYHYSDDNVLGYTFSLNDTTNFSSVRCYGIEFYNSLNIPVNLSQVKWEYDIAWVRWRNAVQIYLRDIYNLLADAPEEDVNAPTYPAYGDDVNNAEPQYSDVAAEDVQQQLDEAVEGVDSYGDAAGQVKTWINDFIPPKILTVIIFALAFGVVILILGKNKDD